MIFFDNSLNSVIQIDLLGKSINFYKRTTGENAEITLKSEHFSSTFGEEEFLETLKGAVSINYNKKVDGKTALILPDELFFVDTIKLPLIQKKAMENSLVLAFNALYQNNTELKYNAFVLSNDKQNANYCIVGVKKDMLAKIITAVNDGGADISAVTFTSGAVVSGAIALNAKLKGSDFMLVDLKEDYTRFTLAVKGNASGFFTVPIGISSFSESEFTREHEFFDHSSAESVVEMAKAKAKNKKVATVRVDDEESVSSDEDSVVVTSRSGKAVKRYPKFMVREEPTTAKGFVFESFRPILKWVSEVLIANEEILADKFDTPVYINLPSEYSYLLEMANAEGDSLKCSALEVLDSKIENMPKIDLYGGFYIKKNKNHLF